MIDGSTPIVELPRARRSDVDVAEVMRSLSLLVVPGATFEIRALGTDRGRRVVRSGYFTDPSVAAEHIARVAASSHGVYATLNTVLPELRARRADRIDVADKGETTGDQHVVSRTRLLIDIDAVRPSGISASDREHDAALSLAAEVADELDACGWPSPLRGDSGNGAHLVYAIDLPVDDGGLVARVLEAAQSRWGCSVDGIALKIDTTVANPSRITKLFGTRTRKGDDVQERPHRMARIVRAPDALDVVTREQLEMFAATHAPVAPPVKPSATSRTGQPFDVSGWLSRHGIVTSEQFTGGDGRTIWVLDVCPFNADHARGEAHVHQLVDGMLGAACKHESCTWGWHELRERFEVDAYSKVSPSPSPTRHTAEVDRRPPAEPTRDVGTHDRNGRPVALLEVAPRQALLASDVAKLDTPPIRSYATGLPDLDRRIGGGVSTRQLLSLLGPPGAGKSAFAMATALHIAPRLPVLYASTELEQHELMARIAGNIIDRPWSAIARGNVPREWVSEALAGIRIRLLGCDVLPRDGSKALELIEREANIDAKEHGVPPLIVIDYLQDLARGSEKDLRARIGDLATDLRSMGQRLDCPIFAVSSVARAYYNERRAAELRAYDDPTVYLAAAKECGDVDYASAVVLFLDVEKGDGERAARIAVAKSRHGDVGFSGARFAGASGRWTSAPEAVAELSAPGRTQQNVSGKLDDADRTVLAVVERMHAAGKRELCTKSQLRTGCGIGTERVPAALERLVHVGRLRLVDIERDEGGKTKRRAIYEPVGATAPAPAPKALELDLEQARGLHAGAA